MALDWNDRRERMTRSEIKAARALVRSLIPIVDDREMAAVVVGQWLIQRGLRITLRNLELCFSQPFGRPSLAAYFDAPPDLTR